MNIEVEDFNLGKTGEIARDSVVEDGGLETDLLVQSDSELNMGLKNLGKLKA